MFFTRTHEFSLPITKDEFKQRLLGKRVKIHNLDFEVIELDYKLNIIPHAEQVTEIKTLPITEVDFKEASGKTKVVVKSKIRTLDAGGPYLIIIFCLFLLIASVTLFFTSDDTMIMYMFLGIGALIFTLFWIRMERGYFDYVRKVRRYVKDRSM